MRSKVAAGSHFVNKNAIESDFLSSKMAAGGHFEKIKKKKKLRIDLKWREMRPKSDFRSSKMAAGGHFEKKKSYVSI